MQLPVNPNTFANNPLDRASYLRADETWLEEKKKDSSSVFVPLWRLNPMLIPGREKTDPIDVAWLTKPAIDSLNLDSPTTVFLGMRDGIAHFAVDISQARDPENSGPLAGLGIFGDLRQTVANIDHQEAAILAQAKSMVDWHTRHRFCANCGMQTKIMEAGYKRLCKGCKSEHFPRTDPVVIMIATHNDRCLLGRQKSWPDKMYSALAGFVEPGESIEEAAARELHEEAGVSVSSVTYHSTQPWPYPSSLMIGCVAEASSDEITVDGIELSDAQWFERAPLKAALEGNGDGSVWVPPPFAIAHQLVKTWIYQE